VYAFILNKFRAKLTTIKANKLNHAGRLTYISSVLASIPIYYLSIVLFFLKILLFVSLLLSESFGGLECMRTMQPHCFLIGLGRTYVNQRKMEDWQSKTCILLTKV
jgi:hypothetical protein